MSCQTAASPVANPAEAAVTGQVKGYPFETGLPEGLPLKGVVLCDQIKSLDWTARRAEFICELPEAALDEVMGKALALLK